MARVENGISAGRGCGLAAGSGSEAIWAWVIRSRSGRLAAASTSEWMPTLLRSRNPLRPHSPSWLHSTRGRPRAPEPPLELPSDRAGRRSGEPRSVTIWFVLDGDRLLLTGGKENPQWCRNVRADGRVRLEIGGSRLEGRARIVEDPDAARAIRDRFVDKYWLARLSRLFGGYTRSVAVEVELARPDDRPGGSR